MGSGATPGSSLYSGPARAAVGVGGVNKQMGELSRVSFSLCKSVLQVHFFGIRNVLVYLVKTQGWPTEFKNRPMDPGCPPDLELFQCLL